MIPEPTEWIDFRSHKMGHARVRVANEMIRQALGFPDNAIVWWVAPAEDDATFQSRTSLVYVASPDLPVVPDGQELPIIEPTMRMTYAMSLKNWNGPEEGEP